MADAIIIPCTNLSHHISLHAETKEEGTERVQENLPNLDRWADKCADLMFRSGGNI